MAGPKGSPRFEYSGWAVGSSTSITGTLGISGSLIVSGALGYYGSSENLVGLMSATTGNMRWFIDGTNGSDSNDGLTSATPKKNFRAITASIPDLIKHNCVLHLTGSVVDSVAMNLYRYVDTGVTFLIDGGPVLTYTLDDGAGGGIVSTATTTGSITVAGAAYAVDLYAGWYIDVLTGPAAGQSRLIQRNTDTTIIPTVNWTVDPVAGATFKIGRPNTSFNSNVLSLGNSGPGTIKLQRFEWGANRFQLFGGFDGRVGGFSTAAILS
ncbi:MAG: hypothetical protein Q8P81_00600, partial [Nanoarchaeota archaeon]|nr:hypothetical protein [Nanoarchaeota archaeon]